MGAGGLNGLGYAAGGLSSGLVDGMKLGSMMADKRAQKMAGGAERMWANAKGDTGGGADKFMPAPGAGVGAFSQDQPPAQPQRQPAMVAMNTDMPSYARTTRSIEDPSGDPGATSPTGARGIYQFTPATWRENAAPGADITDPKAQDDAFQRLTASNSAALTKALGRPPTQAELYLAHQQGAAGAAKLILNPNAPAGTLVDPKNIAVNGGDPNQPASAFISKWTDTFNRKAGADASSQPPAQGTADMAPDGTKGSQARQPFGNSMPLPSRISLVKMLPKTAQQQVLSGNLPPEGSGTLDLKTSIRMIQKAYPGASDLDIFRATQSLLPFMQMDATQAYKSMALQLQQQRIDETTAHNTAMEDQKAQTDDWKHQAQDAKSALDTRKEDDKNYWTGTKEYRLGQELQLKIQKLADTEDKTKQDMDIARQKLADAEKKQADDLEIARKKVVMAQSAAEFKQAQFDYKKLEDSKKDAFKQEQLDYKKAEDAYKDAQKARADAQRSLSSLTMAGADTNPDNAPIVQQDRATATAPLPPQPGAGSNAAPAPAATAKPADDAAKAKVAQLKSNGVSDDEIKAALQQEGYNPADFGF